MNKSYAEITAEKVQAAIATRRAACKDGYVSPSAENAIVEAEQEALDAAMASRDSYQLAHTIGRPSITPGYVADRATMFAIRATKLTI